jgi:hypothetical protein
MCVLFTYRNLLIHGKSCFNQGSDHHGNQGYGDSNAWELAEEVINPPTAPRTLEKDYPK